MENGWSESARAWIADMGEEGDWSRRCVLDPFLDPLFDALPRGLVLDVGCGEGRYARRLSAMGFRVAGFDPTPELITHARGRDPARFYAIARAEQLPYSSGSFDLVLAYLTLIDIEDHRRAVSEMARVLKPGGLLIAANMNDFTTSTQYG